MARGRRDPRIGVANEFGSIELHLRSHGNGDQLVVTDRHSGASRVIDVLALEGLVRAPEWVMAALADPGLSEEPDDRVSARGGGPSPAATDGAASTGGDGTPAAR